MIDSYLRTQLVSIIITENHEDFPAHFGEFADKVTTVCSAPEDWAVNNAELIKLESTLELYKKTYTGASDAVCHVIGVAVGFLHIFILHLSPAIVLFVAMLIWIALQQSR